MNSTHMSILVLQGIYGNEVGITIAIVLAKVSLWKTLKLSVGLFI